MKILITGASGFIGSFIVEEALRRGMETWAAMRRSSSKKYLQDDRIHFIELDFSSQERLIEQLRGHHFDYIVHAAGVTKCLNPDDFFAMNTHGTLNLANAVITLQMPVRRFVFLSSLSIFGAIREQQPYEDIRDTDRPQPNTRYGQSKLKAEEALKSLPLPLVILRPTGVYGPRERDYFLMAKSIKRHIDVAAGHKPQVITFVYVRDVVQAVFLSLEKDVVGQAFFLSDGHDYTSAAFSDLIIKELGNPWCLRVKVPLWVLRAATILGEHISRLTGKTTALNNDKYNILSQRNWKCDIQPAIERLGYQPQWPLDKGTKETIQWYKDNKWL